MPASDSPGQGPRKASDFKGDHPFFLLIREYEGHYPDRVSTSHIVDLNEFRWATIHAELMRKPGVWMLCSKDLTFKTGRAHPVLIMVVEEGEQPYYTSKHVGVLSFSDSESQEVICYGIGKKKRDGEVHRLWLMPNGMVCGSEDVYQLGSDMVKGQL